MGHRHGIPIPVETDADGRPVRFAWWGVVYEVRVIGAWHLADRWWDRERESDRRYFRVMTADLQVLERYRDSTPKGLWVLDRILD